MVGPFHCSASLRSERPHMQTLEVIRNITLSSTLKKLSWLYRVVSFVLLGYGIKTVITQEISASGSRMRGAGWSLQGNDAILIGSVLILTGIYILYVTITVKK